MNTQMATDEYIQALKAGQKELKELTAAGKPTHPAVLDELLPENTAETVVDVGLVEIPTIFFCACRPERRSRMRTACATRAASIS